MPILSNIANLAGRAIGGTARFAGRELQRSLVPGLRGAMSSGRGGIGSSSRPSQGAPGVSEGGLSEQRLESVKLKVSDLTDEVGKVGDTMMQRLGILEQIRDNVSSPGSSSGSPAATPTPTTPPLARSSG